jgi:hypothetical protein
MSKRYYVSPCHEEDRKNTWDVCERRYHGRERADAAISNYDTREQARDEARRKNESAS